NTEIPDSAVYFDTDNMIGVDWGDNDLGVPFTSGGGYHFHARAENFLEIGWKAAEAVLDRGYITQAPTYFSTRVGTSYPTFTIGVTGIRATIDDLVVTVGSTETGSPSDGLVLAGDVIVSANGVSLQGVKDPRVPLGQQLGAAEANDGDLVLGILRSGNPTNVTVTVPVLGPYEATWPLDCAKSSNVVDTVAQYVIDSGELDTSSFFGGLFLLSTGEDKYLTNVAAYADYRVASVLPAIENDPGSWSIGYELLFLSEYYLRTGATNVLPRIQGLCDLLDAGDVEGMYGHSLGQVNPGYGQGGIMNQPGNICIMGMILARECGATVDPTWWSQSIDYLIRYAGHGQVPYGDHRPSGYPDNGAEASAACVWSLLEGATFQSASEYAGLSAADSYHLMERGHTGGGFDIIWRGLGSVHVSPSRSGNLRNMLDRMAWYYDLCRRHDGSFQMPPSDNGGTRYANNDGYGIGAAMVYTASRKALRITGGAPTTNSESYPAHPVTWGNARDREFLQDTHVPAYGADSQRADLVFENLDDPEGVPASYFGRLLFHYNSAIRERAAKILSMRADADSIAELKTALQSTDPRARRAALDGLAGYDANAAPMPNTAIPPQTVSAEFMPLIQAVIDDPSSALYEIDGALLALAKAEPEDIRDNLAFITQYSTHDEYWVRVAAGSALAGLGAEISGEQFILLAEIYTAMEHVKGRAQLNGEFEHVLTDSGAQVPDPEYTEAVQIIGRCLHKPKILDRYGRWGVNAAAHRTMMVFEEFTGTDLMLDIADDVGQYFNLWVATNDANLHTLWNVSATPPYHRGFYGYADQMGAAGSFLIQPMKRTRDQAWDAITNGNTDRWLPDYYDAVTNSITLYENDYGEVLPYPGLLPTATAVTAEVIGGWGTDAELVLDGSLSSDPDGTLYDYVWEANGEYVARGAVATGFAAYASLTNLTLRVTDDQAHQHQVAVSVITNPVATTFGLVGYWPMDQAWGSQVLDYTPYTNHGAAVEGTPAWS
ncbi:MAG: hypothetical protein GWP74_09205, partial [Proteobacteria bacterium]|nr:hypothetical protein [Pseudomonadota bacterium]